MAAAGSVQAQSGASAKEDTMGVAQMDTVVVTASGFEPVSYTHLTLPTKA